MSRIFSLEGSLMKTLDRVFNLLALSCMWLLFSLPIVTMGASTTALYDAVYRYVRNDEGYLWTIWWKSFKGNFKRSTLVWIPFLFFLLFLLMDLSILKQMREQGLPLSGLYWIILALLAVALDWGVFLAAYCARFNGGARDIFRCSFLLMTVHPILSLEILGLLVAGFILFLTFPAFIVFIPATLFWLGSYITEKIFRQHLSKEDRERVQHEEE